MKNNSQKADWIPMDRDKLINLIVAEFIYPTKNKDFID